MYWRAAAFAAIGIFAFYRAALGGEQARLMAAAGLMAVMLAGYLLARARNGGRS